MPGSSRAASEVAGITRQGPSHAIYILINILFLLLLFVPRGSKKGRDMVITNSYRVEAATFG